MQLRNHIFISYLLLYWSPRPVKTYRNAMIETVHKMSALYLKKTSKWYSARKQEMFNDQYKSKEY